VPRAASSRASNASSAALPTVRAAAPAGVRCRPVRWLIGPGLLLVGGGLLLMCGLDPSTSWTHLIPGFVVAGLGSGLVNAPLASTAIGVVEPHNAGMASGINTTFRQVGIATSIAALGSIFATKMHGATPATYAARYASGIDELLLITALLALAAGVAALLLIRQQDFVAHRPPEAPAAADAPPVEQLA
jgi:MFS family permease